MVLSVPEQFQVLISFNSNDPQGRLLSLLTNEENSLFTSVKGHLRYGHT